MNRRLAALISPNQWMGSKSSKMLRIFTSFVRAVALWSRSFEISLRWSSPNPCRGSKSSKCYAFGILRCTKKPSLSGLGFFCFAQAAACFFNHQVDPERFELSSKHGTNYAFYMLSSYFIVGKGKANCLPVPSSVGVLSYRVITPLNPGQLCCSMPLMLSYKAEPSGTKAMLILN